MSGLAVVAHLFKVLPAFDENMGLGPSNRIFSGLKLEKRSAQIIHADQHGLDVFIRQVGQSALMFALFW